MTRNPLMRVVLVMAALLLAGVVVLAAAGRNNGISVSKDGRFVTASHASGQITPAQFPSGYTTLAGNLSRYPFGVFFCCYGYTLSGPASFLGQNWIAVPFTLTANHTVYALEASVGYVEGTNSVTLSLNADSGGLPGTALATADSTNLENYGSCCQLAIIKDPAGIPVTAGTQYWVVASTDSTNSDVFDAWAFNSTDMRETYTYAFQNANTGGAWESSEGLLPGWAVIGK
jgi:hypothetical protein